jgi:hypothetical protein
VLPEVKFVAVPVMTVAGGSEPGKETTKKASPLPSVETKSRKRKVFPSPTPEEWQLGLWKSSMRKA